MLLKNVLLFVLVGVSVSCGQTEVQSEAQPEAQSEAQSGPALEFQYHASTDIKIAPMPPSDIEGGAWDASLEQAASFAWSQLIALNWPAVDQTAGINSRGVSFQAKPGTKKSDTGLRVWETLRTKTEIFPGVGEPHGVEAGAQADYGYDEPPLYRYDPQSVGRYPGLEPGLVPACLERQEQQPVPWIELSESHEVGPERMYAGAAPLDAYQGADSSQRILYAVKISREFYRYVAAREWLNGGNPGTNIPAAATEEYYLKNGKAPAPEAEGLVSFPDQTMQIKTAWRRLSPEEMASGRFHTAWARSYQAQESGKTYHGQAGNPDFPCFVDAEWGMIGIHIKTKTKSAPYYLWATFEQLDTLSDINGRPVEDESGRLIRNADLPTTDPVITARNAMAAVPATPQTIQKMSPETAQAVPQKRLYYRNTSGTPTTQGVIAINRRDHAIPPPVIAVNEVAHEAIRRFNEDAGEVSPVSDVLLNYKLVGIQWKPASKPVPGQDVVGDPAASNPVLRHPLVYYLANMVLETSYRLQHYSGTVQARLPAPNQALGVQDLITDFDSKGKPVVNVMYDGIKGNGETLGFNMGGCMGCHGQMQIKGYDFNFIFRRGRVNAPAMDVSIRMSLADMVYADENHD